MSPKTIITLFSVFLLFGYSNGKFSDDKYLLSVYIKLAANGKLSYNQRLTYNRKSLQLLSAIPADSLSLIKYVSVCSNFYHLNALKDLHDSATMFRERSKGKSLYSEAKSLRWIGVYYECMSLNDSAFYYYRQAEKIFKKTHSMPDLSENFQDQAQAQYYANDYLGAEKSLTKALRIAKSEKLIRRQFLLNTFLGTVSYDLGDLDKSLEYHTKALKMVNNYPENFGDFHYAVCMNDLGRHYLATHQYAKSIGYFRKGLGRKSIEFESGETYSRLLDNLGKALIKSKKDSALPDVFFKAKEFRNRNHIYNGSNFNRIYLSEYYFSKNDSMKAIQYAKEALDLSKGFKAPNDILFSLRQLMVVETNKALEYSQEYIKISDSMQLLERENRNKFAKIAFETEEITNEKEAAIQQKKVFLAIAITVCAIGVLIFIIIMQRSKQKELNFVQEQQRKDEKIYELIHTQQVKLDEARQIEKKRIALDLHDSVLNRLASTRLNLHVLDANSDAQTINKCLPFINGIQDIEKEIRNIAHDLNAEMFKNKDGFLEVVTNLFKEQGETYPANIHFEIDRQINWEALETSKKIHIYRILQEALNNINKHADAKSIIISICERENTLLVEIYDDGKGFNFKAKNKGIGLQGMALRAKSFGGTFKVVSKKGEPTTLIITVPKFNA